MMNKAFSLFLLLGLGITTSVDGETSSSYLVSQYSNSSKAQATTIYHYDNIKDFLQAIKNNEINYKDKPRVSLKLNNAKVLAAGSYNVFLRDDSNAATFIRFSKITDKAKYNNQTNAIVDGEVCGILDYYNVTNTLCIYPQSDADVNNLTFTPSSEEAQPIEITEQELGEHLYDLVKIKGVSVKNTNSSTSSTNWTKVVIGKGIKLSNNYIGETQSILLTSPYNNAIVDIVGIVTYQKSDKSQSDLSIRETDDITYVIGETRENVIEKVNGINLRFERTLNSSYWNTFCVPIAISSSKIQKIFGNDTKIARYKENNENTLLFESVSSIKAGEPYLIKPENTVVNPVFKSVSITSVSPTTPSSTATYQLIGVYNPTDLEVDKTNLFITTQGKASYPSEGHNTIKGLRAYIKCNSNNAKNITLSLDGIKTDIQMVDGLDMLNATNKVYNMHGQYVGNNLKGLPKGVYIVNKQKIFIK